MYTYVCVCEGACVMVCMWESAQGEDLHLCHVVGRVRIVAEWAGALGAVGTGEATLGGVVCQSKTQETEGGRTD